MSLHPAPPDNAADRFRWPPGLLKAPLVCTCPNRTRPICSTNGWPRIDPATILRSVPTGAFFLYGISSDGKIVESYRVQLPLDDHRKVLAAHWFALRQVNTGKVCAISVTPPGCRPDFDDSRETLCKTGGEAVLAELLDDAPRPPRTPMPPPTGIKAVWRIRWRRLAKAVTTFGRLAAEQAKMGTDNGAGDCEPVPRAVADRRGAEESAPPDEAPSSAPHDAGAPRPAPKASPPGSAVLVMLAGVEPVKVRWLDPGRVPLDTLTIIDGDPGVGKTSIALDYAARVSTGRDMPDRSHGDLYEKPAGVVILSAEDDPAITLRPKLDAMGADVKRIAILAGVVTKDGERMPNLTDLAAIEDAIKRVDTKLVIVDPLMAYLPGTKNAHRDQDMRAVLTPLIKLVGRLGVALLVVRHLTKQTSEPVKVSALYRGGGSIGIAGAARSVLLVAPHDTDEDGERRVLVRVKGNLSKPPKGLLFRLTSNREDEPAIVRWEEGEVDQAADDLVRAPTEEEEPSKIGEGKEWLRSTLAEGPVPATQVYSEAAKVGIAKRTLERAKKALKVRSEAEEGTIPPRWRWRLPDSKANQ